LTKEVLFSTKGGADLT